MIVFDIFKNVEKRLNMLSTDMKDIEDPNWTFRNKNYNIWDEK